MSDDIVIRLRNHAEDEAMLGNDWLRDVMRDGADEIKRLRTALQLAVGELSTHDTHRLYSPDQLYQQFLEEARRG